MINIGREEEVDLDCTFNLTDIKTVVSDDKFFYVLANKRYHKLGNYLLKLD
jgi:hypothetical protein